MNAKFEDYRPIDVGFIQVIAVEPKEAVYIIAEMRAAYKKIFMVKLKKGEELIPLMKSEFRKFNLHEFDKVFIYFVKEGDADENSK